MLRHRLYKSQEKQVALYEEINYLNNYMKIMESYKKINCALIIKTNENMDNIFIPPLILGNILEYVIENLPDCTDRLYLNVMIRSSELSFEFKNFTEISPNDYNTYSIINPQIVYIKQKLEKLFPSKHLFEGHKDKNQIYIKITLNHDNKIHTNKTNQLFDYR